jgi:ParB/RepB/Spo0J family partition protein
MNLSKVGKVTAGKVKTTGVSDFMELEIELVYPNPAQPRKAFNDIDELADSIKHRGLIQPIAVVKDGAGKYMIISGERRFRACTLLGLKTIKCHIITASSKDIEEMALIENIQRSDLTDFEIANFITVLWNSGQYEKKQDLSEALGKKPAYLSKALGLVDKLDDSIKEDLADTKSDIGMSVLEEVSRVKDKDTQKEVYEKVKNKELKRDEIKEYKKPNKVKEKKDTFTGENDEILKKIKSGRTAIDKISAISKCSNDCIVLPIGDIGAFHFYNRGIGSTKLFKDNVSYQLTIEEAKETKEDFCQISGSDVEKIRSDLEKAVHYHATLDGNKVVCDCIDPTHLDNDYEIEMFKMLIEIQEFKNRLNTDFKIPIASQSKPMYQEYFSNLTLKDIKDGQLNWRVGNGIEDDSFNCDIIIKEKTSPAFWEGKTSKEVDAEYHKVEILEEVRSDIKMYDIEEQSLDDIKSSISWIKELIELEAIKKDTLFGKKANIIECEPDSTGCRKFHEFKNPYEEIIYGLYKEIKELQCKEIYIISYQHKTKGVPHGGGYRVRALSRDEAIELGKEHYKDVAKDKKIVFTAETLIENENSILDFQKRKEGSFLNKTSYGFGTVNDMGTFICAVDGDFEGTFTFREGGEFIEQTHNKEYKVTIEDTRDNIKKITTKKVTPKDNIIIHENQTEIKDFIEEPKEIKHMEIFNDNIYIEFTDNDCETLSHNKAKQIIKNSTQKVIPYKIHGQTEKSCNFVNNMPHRIQVNGELILKEKKK